MTQIKITTEEHAELIRNSGPNGCIHTTFGPRGVFLAEDKDGNVMSAWALPILMRMRGKAFEDGAGI